MARRQQSRVSARGPEVSVSRLEAHHVDALAEGGAELLAAARELQRQRTEGEGFGLVAVVDALPVGLLGVRFGEDGWQLHGLLVADSASGQQVDVRLVAAAEELARPLGSITLLDGSRRQLAS